MRTINNCNKLTLHVFLISQKDTIESVIYFSFLVLSKFYDFEVCCRINQYYFKAILFLYFCSLFHLPKYDIKDRNSKA